MTVSFWVLGQAARQYNKNAVEILRMVGFTSGTVNTCLYMKKSMKGITYIALYVDDELMI